MRTTGAAAWIDALRPLIGDWPEPVVIAGPGAAELAAACQAAGAPPISAEGIGVVAMSRTEAPSSCAGFDDLPEEWAGLVVLRSVWRDRTEVGPSLRSAARILRRGGRVLAGEMDVARMLGTSAVRYPARLLFSARPELAGAVRATTIGRAMLSAETVRAGFGFVEILDVEEERAAFPSAEAYWDYARSGGWPALSWLPAEDAESAVRDTARDLARVAPIGPVVDRVPFVAATGIRR